MTHFSRKCRYLTNIHVRGSIQSNTKSYVIPDGISRIFVVQTHYYYQPAEHISLSGVTFEKITDITGIASAYVYMGTEILAANVKKGDIITLSVTGNGNQGVCAVILGQ